MRENFQKSVSSTNKNTFSTKTILYIRFFFQKKKGTLTLKADIFCA